MLDDRQLQALAQRLVGVSGVAGVTLGGSRARGTHTPESDIDLGLYYRSSLDLQELGKIARDVAGPGAHVTSPGEWGPWVDGGAWLTIDDTPVDWIYRDIDRVHTSWDAAQAGRFQFHAQVGHPLGIPDFAYAGEIALAVVLADPTGELTALQNATRAYPSTLQHAVIGALWEAGFAIEIAKKAVSRTAPHEFELHAIRLLGKTGTTEAELAASIIDAAELLASTTRACGREVDTGLYGRRAWSGPAPKGH